MVAECRTSVIMANMEIMGVAQQRDIIGREVVIVPFEGESDISESFRGIIDRRFLWGKRETYVVQVSPSIVHTHPGIERPLVLDQVWVMPDGTDLSWAFFGGGPRGLPVLVKVIGLLPADNIPAAERNYKNTFLLARGEAQSPP